MESPALVFVNTLGLLEWKIPQIESEQIQGKIQKIICFQSYNRNFSQLDLGVYSQIKLKSYKNLIVLFYFVVVFIKIETSFKLALVISLFLIYIFIKFKFIFNQIIRDEKVDTPGPKSGFAGTGKRVRRDQKRIKT